MVTVFAMRDAVESLNQDESVPEEDVNVMLMLVFSGANLVSSDTTIYALYCERSPTMANFCF